MKITPVNINKISSEDFLRHTRREGAHLLWTGKRGPRGYGRFRNQYVHRISAAMFNGADTSVPILHGPGCPTNCVEPTHLRPGTHKENSQQRFLDGEVIKLTVEQVLAIYSDERHQSAIAEDYGVCQAMVSNIKSGYRWSAITGAQYERVRRAYSPRKSPAVARA